MGTHKYLTHTYTDDDLFFSRVYVTY